MKINWKIRFKNRVWLLTFIGAIVAFVYQICSIFGIVPIVAEDQVMDFVKILLTLLVGLGVIVDPTTSGTADSERALTYGTDKDVRKDEK
ncbi:MAG: phage holin [Clostridiales bacterium]|nr:phage holin [Clostridiales bacterium]MDY6116379.1 phage holin [Anaerovoracaceae bacterium]